MKGSKRIILLLIMLVFFVQEKINSQQNSAKPNIVLIYLDDIGSYNFPTYRGRTMSGKGFTNVPIKTPNIDKLSNQGLRCEKAFTHPVCEPSRIALMTGQNNGRNYIVTKGQHHSQITFGDVFQKEGYATGMFGKWKQTRGTKSIPAKRYISEFGWDEYVCFDVITEGQRFINPNLVINDEVVNYTGRTDLDPATGRRWYGPDIVNRGALKFIEDHKNEPFFLYYPMLLMHDPHKPTPDTRPESIFDNYPETKSKNEIKYFPDMLAYMDKLIGRVITKLEQVGVRDNTLVVFLADNGTVNGVKIKMNNGEVVRGGKGFTRYDGESVPLIFNWPNKVNAGVYNGVTNVSDIFSTIADACNIKIPSGTNLDGTSMWSQISGTNSGKHRDALYRWYNGFRPMTDTEFRVRYAMTDKYKYYTAHDVYPKGRLFNIQRDKYELEGKKGKKVGYDVFWHAGINLNNLNSEEKAAYQKLKAITDKNAYKKIKKITITGSKNIVVGEKLDLNVKLTPSDVTLNNVIWTSDNNSIATIDKFGVVTGKNSGKVKITVYSWDDARPLGRPTSRPEFIRSGVKDVVEITVGGSGNAEQVSCSQLPLTIDASGNYTVKASYTASGDRELVLILQKGTQWLGNRRLKVTKGTGTVNLPITIRSAPLVAGNNYNWQLMLRPVGGEFDTNTTICKVDNIIVGSGPVTPEEQVGCTQLPLTINTSGNYNVKASYTANGNRDLVLILQNGTQWLGNRRLKVTKGSGTVNLPIRIRSAPLVPGNNYNWQLMLRPVGGEYNSNRVICRIDDVVVGGPNLSKNQIENIQLYPQPVNNILNLIAPNNKNEAKLTIRLFNLSGEHIKTEHFNNGDNKLDVSSLDSGVYFLEVIQGSSKKILKFVKK